MPDNSQNQNISNEELSARIATLEGYVEELGHTLYELIEKLHGINPGDCPPICARATEMKTS